MMKRKFIACTTILIIYNCLSAAAESYSTLDVASDAVNRKGRGILHSYANCACVCSGTHEGYTSQVAATPSECSVNSCMNLYPSCTSAGTKANYLEGTLSSGSSDGTLVKESSTPARCEIAIIGEQCSQEYKYSIDDTGFIRLVSSSTQECALGSAMKSNTHTTLEKLASGFFVGNQNSSDFTLTRKGKNIILNLNQGCLITYSFNGKALLDSVGGKCFPGAAKVLTTEGVKYMSQLNVGDSVLVARNGLAEYRTIYMFSHQNHDVFSKFQTFHTESGHAITVSPTHYMWANKVNDTKSVPVNFRIQATRRLTSDLTHKNYIEFNNGCILRAMDLKRNDLLWIMEDDGLIRPSPITNITSSTERGLFNPHTTTGTIIVDGVTAMTFTDTLPPSSLVHILATLPGAILYSISLTKSMAQYLNTIILKLIKV